MPGAASARGRVRVARVDGAISSRDGAHRRIGTERGSSSAGASGGGGGSASTGGAAGSTGGGSAVATSLLAPLATDASHAALCSPSQK
jgi:hypothetical protein